MSTPSGPGGEPVPPQQPPPWGPVPPWPSPQALEGRSRAETALVLGILSVVVLPLLGPFAVWQAGEAEKLGVPATAGRVLGWVGTALLVVGAVLFALWAAVAVYLVTSNGG
ncbi:DUF4190 domain-containing protein [Kocuria sp. LUK]|uniref:DUF4190 domain-containing protein n=1 Tax=Kocuria sp. LUK TaxID=2897828 RepID=UPI001E397880|nr:DUF4190 domain-containing protein [Kocuria sp. LUK]MCD1145342.1 DUF4190 domain-containing protein [Kocuria sp. LUK]